MNTIGLLQEIWDQICFVSMMECSDGEFELVSELSRQSSVTDLEKDARLYPNDAIQIDCFIAVVLNLCLHISFAGG